MPNLRWYGSSLRRMYQPATPALKPRIGTYLYCPLCKRETKRTISLKVAGFDPPCSEHSAYPEHRPHPLIGKVPPPVYRPGDDIKPPAYSNKIIGPSNERGELKVSSIFAETLNLDPAAPVSTIVTCTFCDRPVDNTTATYGKGHLRKVLRTVHTYDDDGQIIASHVKMIHYTDSLIACPDCVLNIRPTVHKDGSVTNNIKFPDFD